MDIATPASSSIKIRRIFPFERTLPKDLFILITYSPRNLPRRKFIRAAKSTR